MPLPSLHELGPLADISTLCDTIMASPAFREMFVPLGSAQIGPDDRLIGVTCGELIAAIYDLLEGTPLAPFASDIARAVLVRAVLHPGSGQTTH